MKKFIRDLFFITVSILFAIVLLNILVYKIIDTVPKTERKIFVSKRMIFNNSTDNYDTIFWGSSMVFRQIVPDLFDDITGHKSFNFGVQGCFPPQCTKLFEYMLPSFKNKGIKTVFFELAGIQALQKNCEAEETYANFSELHSFEALLFYKYKHNSKVQDFQNLFSAIFNKYTRAIRILFYKELKQPIQDLAVGHGYLTYKNLHEYRENNPLAVRRKIFLKEKKLAQDGIYRDYTNKFPRPKTQIYLNYFKNILDKYKEAGIRIIFIIPPITNKGFIDWQYKSFLVENKIPILNFSSVEKYPELYNLDLYFDHSHLNKNGAELYTKLLAKKVLTLNI
jgi:hypothetical protein